MIKSSNMIYPLITYNIFTVRRVSTCTAILTNEAHRHGPSLCSSIFHQGYHLHTMKFVVSNHILEHAFRNTCGPQRPTIEQFLRKDGPRRAYTAPLYNDTGTTKQSTIIYRSECHSSR